MIMLLGCLLPDAFLMRSVPLVTVAADKFIMDCNPSIAAVSDLDGDSLDDLILGSPWAMEGRGQVWVVSGASDKVLGTMAGKATRQYFGRTVSGVGDADGDGLGEIMVWSDGYTGPTAGEKQPARLTLLSSRNYAPLWEIDFESTLSVDSMGPTGDINGDGVGDLWVGAPNWPDRYSMFGVVMLVSGKSGEILHRRTGTAIGERLGDTVCLLGDTNGDGLSELAASSAPRDPQDMPRKPGASAPSPVGPRINTVSLLSGKDLEVLVQIPAPAGSTDFGWALHAAPDLNGDHVEDLLVSSRGCESCENEEMLGQIFCYSGQTQKLLGSVRGRPVKEWDSFGFSLAPVSASTSEAPRLWVGAAYGEGWSGAVYEYSLPEFTALRKVAFQFQALELKMGSSLAVLYDRRDGKKLPYRLAVRGCSEDDMKHGYFVALVKTYSLQALECEAVWKFGETIHSELRPGVAPR